MRSFKISLVTLVKLCCHLEQSEGSAARVSSRVSSYCYHSRVNNPQDSPSSLSTVFLDRDGVINRKMPEGQYVTALHHFELLDGVPQAIAQLNRAGLRVLVVTNQRGIALGLYTAADVRHIHAHLQAELAAHNARIDGFYFCPHDKKECNCRKPLPGLFEQAQGEFSGIQPSGSLIIGDSLSDIEFGRNVGMKTIFIEGDPEHRKPGAEKAATLADSTASSLPEAVNKLLPGV
jgi:D-glycero-D-manno-heptose 1,7-bisphosphate phosphatase